MCVCVCAHVLGLLEDWEQRTVKRLRLSKVKTGKYYDSGCLVVFYLASVVWGLDIILSSGYATSPSLIWQQYPHTLMRLATLSRVPMLGCLSLQPLPQVLHAHSNGVLAALLPRAHLHEGQEGGTSVQLTCQMSRVWCVQDEVYSKMVLYTSSLLIIAGAYMMM